MHTGQVIRTGLGLLLPVVMVLAGCEAGDTAGQEEGPHARAATAGPISVTGVYDNGVWGVHVDLLYRAGQADHITRATLRAVGISGRTDMYKVGTDTSGMGQQPTLSPGEQASIAAFTFPACGTTALGDAPELVVSYAEPAGGTRETTVPLPELAERLQQVATGWCRHDVMIEVTTSRGWPGCELLSATLNVRNPSPMPVRLTVDGATYRATGLTVPANGSAPWAVTGDGRCPFAVGSGTATVHHADGTFTHVSLGMDAP